MSKSQSWDSSPGLSDPQSYISALLCHISSYAVNLLLDGYAFLLTKWIYLFYPLEALRKHKIIFNLWLGVIRRNSQFGELNVLCIKKVITGF